MRGHRLTRLAVLLAFSVLLGHFAWRCFGPPSSPAYFVGGRMSAMTGPDPNARHLYLRHKFYLSERPRHSWLQALSRGRVRIYVNGKLLAERSPDGTMGALLVDPTPLLQVGPNVLAIATEQYSPRRPAMVTLDAAYTLADGEHRLGGGPSWHATDRFEREKDWWFMPDFDDQDWPVASLVAGHFQGAIKLPPRSITEPPIGHWIAPLELGHTSAYLRRQFDVHGRPRQGWLRLSTPSMHRVAINGVVIDVHEEVAGISKPPAPSRRIYDITPFLRSGQNVIAIALETNAGPTRLNCDWEVEEESGPRSRIGSDERWLCSTEEHVDWLGEEPAGDPTWKPCQVEPGYLGMMPWDGTASLMQLPVPFSVKASRVAAQLAAMLAIFVVSSLGCWIVGWMLAWGADSRAVVSAQGAAVLALVPSTVLLAVSWLATFDPRVAWQDVYRVSWVAFTALLVAAHWLVFGLMRLFGWPAARGRGVRGPQESEILIGSTSPIPLQPKYRGRRLAISMLVSVIVLVGFVIRLPGVANRPLGADEVNMYRCVQGFYERGFPSFVVHKDLPPQYISTSELVYVGGALAALFFDDDRYVIRFPSVCWGTLTIILIYVIGRDMFHPVVGLVAAALYAFAPVPLAMANFGRYPSQLQFFTGLTTYYFWRTLAVPGPLNRRYLLFTTLSVIAMFLSWEPSLLLAPGMIVAALWMRRGRLQTIVGDPRVWCAIGAVAAALLLQI
jgi:Dolichyl-phosphate-mannose-protein mannosyltransferase